jgi:hypothetical protein
MFSQNPRIDLFTVIFPDSFFISELTEKYNSLLSQKPYILDSIEDILRESIQSFESPRFGFSVIEQMTKDPAGAGYNINQTPMQSMQTLAEKTFSISFRHSDGFLTYFLMMEHFFKRYEMGPGTKETRKPFGTIILETLLPNGLKVSRIKFRDCKLTTIPSLELSYSSPSRDFSTFECEFAYNTFETTFDLPDLKLKPVK